MLGSNKLYRVNKGDLLEKIRENRTKHAEEYKTALVKYRERAIKALTKQLANASEEKRRFSLTFTLPKPVNYLKQYDNVIGLLEMTTDQVIEISPGDYSCYVLDQWEWKTNFKYATASYNSWSGPQGVTGATGSTGPQGSSGPQESSGDDVNYGSDDEDDE